jgi:uncharacterized membrane protein
MEGYEHKPIFLEFKHFHSLLNVVFTAIGVEYNSYFNKSNNYFAFILNLWY